MDARRIKRLVCAGRHLLDVNEIFLQIYGEDGEDWLATAEMVEAGAFKPRSKEYQHFLATLPDLKRTLKQELKAAINRL